MKRVVWDESERVGKWVFDHFGSHFDPLSATALGVESDGQIVGGCVYEKFAGQSLVMHCAGTGHWLTREFLRAMFAYPFVQLGVKKVIGPVDSSNEQARAFNEHLGFVPEAVIADGAPYGDLIMYTLTRQQCRYLGV